MMNIYCLSLTVVFQTAKLLTVIDDYCDKYGEYDAPDYKQNVMLPEVR